MGLKTEKNIFRGASNEALEVRGELKQAIEQVHINENFQKTLYIINLVVSKDIPRK